MHLWGGALLHLKWALRRFNRVQRTSHKVRRPLTRDVGRNIKNMTIKITNVALLATSIIFLSTIDVCARILFDITFEDPPHHDGIISAPPTHFPSDMPYQTEDSVTSITNVEGMSGQSAIVDSFLGYSGFWLHAAPNLTPPYPNSSTSGVNIIEWKIRVTDWTSHSWPQAEMRADSQGDGTAFSVMFYYTGGTVGTVRVSGKSITQFTTNQTYKLKAISNIEQHTLDVWMDDFQIVSNAYTAFSNIWYMVFTAGLGVGSRVVYDDVRWENILPPNILQITPAQLSWASESGTEYIVECSSVIFPASWSNLTDTLIATNDFSTIEMIPIDIPSRFIRVKTLW